MALNAGYNVTNFMFECNGKSAGYLSSFTAPTYEVEEIKQALNYIKTNLAPIYT